MRAPPAFWSDPGARDHPAARLLAPLGRAYGWATRARLARAEPYVSSLPVVCVGNATLGGVGKTPFAILLVRLLSEMGRAPHVLTRGYGGTEAGPHRVSRADAPARVGDEALLLAEHAQVVVAADRAAGARAVETASGPTGVIVMDDGFQNPGLAKTLSFLLVDAEAMFGNARLFPAGPLREPPEAAAARAQAIVAVGGEPDAGLHALADGKPLLRADLALDEGAVPDGPLHAFAGIGRPERFFASLARAGGHVAATHPFPDHHPYTEADLAPLVAAAKVAGATLVTTAKDAVRVPPAYRAHITAVPARMTSPDEDRIRTLLEAL